MSRLHPGFTFTQNRDLQEATEPDWRQQGLDEGEPHPLVKRLREFRDAASFHVRELFKLDSRDMVRAFSAGVSMAIGAAETFLDPDDAETRTRLRRRVEELEREVIRLAAFEAENAQLDAKPLEIPTGVRIAS